MDKPQSKFDAERGDEVRPRVLELAVFRLHVRGPARGVVGAGEAAGGGRDVSFASVGFEAATGWEAPSSRVGRI